MPRKPEVSVIIVHYGKKEKLFNCLLSIERHKPKVSFEVIVVDNDEKKTIEKLLTTKFPWVTYIKAPGNIGYAAGNNLGAKLARGKYLFVLNPDTEIFSKAIDKLVEFLDRNKKAAIVAPNLIDKKGKVLDLIGTKELTPIRGMVALSFLNKLFPNNPISRTYWLRNVSKEKIREVDVVPGSAFLIRRKIFEKVGGFDEKFFLYFEESDLCKRVKEAGWKVFISPEAKVFHEWKGVTPRTRRIKRIFEESRFYYFKKHYGTTLAAVVEAFARFSKWHLTLIAILGLATFLRFWRMGELMHFIGDFGWYYLSARDMILTGEIPLVGIPSSVPILRQGALWTWILSLALWLGSFNPLSGGYLAAFLGVASVFGVYILASRWFGKRVAFFASTLTATSPFIVNFDRTPYQTAGIFPATILVAWSLLSVQKGDEKHFFLLGLWLAVLFQFELAGFILVPIILLAYIWQRFKLNFFSILKFFLGGIIGLAPFIIHDIKAGVFIQTLGFLAWFVGKTFEGIGAVFTGQRETLIISPALEYLKEIVLAPSLVLALLFLAGSVYSLFRLLKKYGKFAHKFLFVWFVVGLTSFLVRGVYSQAYIPLLYLPIILMLSFFFERLIEFKKTLGISVFFFVVLANVISLLRYFSDPQRITFYEKLEVASYIVSEAFGKSYQLVYVGPNDEFAAGDSNYRYLLWWKGNEPVKRADLVYVIVEPGYNMGLRVDKISEIGSIKVGLIEND